MKWSDLAQDYTKRYAFLRPRLGLAADTSVLSSPVDQGAKQLLSEYESAPLAFSPFALEDLFKSLSRRIARCLEIRSEAHDLEVRLANQTIDIAMQEALLAAARKQLDATRAQEPNFLGNLTNIQVNGSTIRGDIGGKWAEVYAAQVDQINAKQAQIDAQKAYLEQPGVGPNFADRLSHLKRSFDSELKGSYLRARAIAVGLNEVFKESLPLPPLDDLSYLDYLVRWFVDASSAFERNYMTAGETTLLVSLVDTNVLSKQQYIDQLKTGVLNFTLGESIFSSAGITNPRLRAIDIFVQLERSNDLTLQDFWSATVTLPAVSIAGEQLTKKIPVAPVAFANNPARSTSRGDNMSVYNWSPIGPWQVNINSPSIRGSQLTKYVGDINSLTLQMRLSHSAA